MTEEIKDYWKIEEDFSIEKVRGRPHSKFEGLIRYASSDLEVEKDGEHSYYGLGVHIFETEIEAYKKLYDILMDLKNKKKKELMQISEKLSEIKQYYLFLLTS